MSSRKRKKAFALLVLSYISSNELVNEKPRKKRQVWVKDWLRDHETLGAYNNILQELRFGDADGFRSYLRMDSDTYEFILAGIRDKITLKTTKFRKPISPEEQLSITLRFMATGESFTSLSFQFRVANNTISLIVRRVSEAIIDAFMESSMPFPKDGAAWKKIADLYEERWNFPNCIGGLDGKHVAIFRPHNAVSEYFNYKGYNSIVIMALVDANYKFIFADIGCQGRLSDGAVFRNSKLAKMLADGSLSLPEERQLPDLNMGADDDSFLDGDRILTPMPYVIVADAAFPLGTHIMCPYASNGLTEGKRLFNYRPSWTSENSFGILVNIFRVFHTKICLSVSSARLVTMACCVLHNLLRDVSPNFYTPKKYVGRINSNGDIYEGEWRQEEPSPYIHDFRPSMARHAPLRAEEIRDNFKGYFQSRGNVHWQYKHVYIS